MEEHVNFLGLFGLNLSIDNPISHVVVGLQWSGGLLVSHLLQDDAHVDGFYGHDVQFC